MLIKEAIALQCLFINCTNRKPLLDNLKHRVSLHLAFYRSNKLPCLDSLVLTWSLAVLTLRQLIMIHCEMGVPVFHPIQVQGLFLGDERRTLSMRAKLPTLPFVGCRV